MEFVEIAKFFRRRHVLTVLPDLIRELNEKYGERHEKTLRAWFEYGMTAQLEVEKSRIRGGAHDSLVVMASTIKKMEKYLGRMNEVTLDSKLKFDCLRRKIYYVESGDWMRVETHLNLLKLLGRGRYLRFLKKCWL